MVVEMVISFTAPSNAMRSSRSNLFTNCNFPGGTTFGSQNQSGGTDFGGGTKIFVTPPLPISVPPVKLQLVNKLDLDERIALLGAVKLILFATTNYSSYIVNLRDQLETIYATIVLAMLHSVNNSTNQI